MVHPDAREITAVAVVCIAMYTDLRSGKIRNALTLPAMLLGVALNGWLEGGAGLLHSLQGVGLSVLILAVSSACGGALGGGDLKLLASIGALCGPAFLIVSFCVAALVGGVLAVVVAVRHGQLSASCSRCFTWLAFRLGTRTAVPVIGRDGSLRLPYAVAIAGGVILTIAWQSLPVS